jgi:hypothetical protein
MGPSREARRSWGYVSLLWLVTLVLAPTLWVAFIAHAAWQTVVSGAAIWAVSIALKQPAAKWLNLIFSHRDAYFSWALSQGLLSSLLELGASAAYLQGLKNASLASVLAFGIGAGSGEVIYVLGLGFFTKTDPDALAAWTRAAADSLCVRYQVPIERMFALIGHVGSRGILYVGLHSSRPAQALLLITAVVLFALVDSVAYYGHLRGWNWSDPPLCAKTQGFFALVSIIELVTFLILFWS